MLFSLECPYCQMDISCKVTGDYRLRLSKWFKNEREALYQEESFKDFKDIKVIM